MIGERMVEGFSALTLASPDAGSVEAAFVPDAGMVGCSLRHRGEELLGQRGGLRAYVAERGDDGDPAAPPVGEPARPERRFAVAGREVDLESRSTAAERGSQRAADPRLARRGERLAGGAARACGGWRSACRQLRLRRPRRADRRVPVSAHSCCSRRRWRERR